jgi:hypothetical protein
MRRHLKQLMTLMFAASLLAAATATAASAANVTVSPGGTTAGTGGALQFIFNTYRTTITCTTTGYSARYLAGTFTGVSLAFTFSDSTDAQLTFSGCRRPGGAPMTVTCTRATRLKATYYTAGGVTQVSINAIACVATFTGSTCRVNIGGDVSGTHDNSTGEIVVSTTGQSLASSGSSSGSGGGCALLPNDPSVTLSSSPSGFGLVYTESPVQTITVT